MSLSRKIAAAVDDLIRTCGAPSTVTAEDGPHRLEVAVGLATPVGVSCDRLEFATTTTPPGGEEFWSLDALNAWGNRLAARVTYLLEPLVPHESDAQSGSATYRSARPSQRDGRRAFYEAQFHRDGRARIVRYVYDETTRRREPTPCHFTREVLERLAEDLVSSVESVEPSSLVRS